MKRSTICISSTKVVTATGEWAGLEVVYIEVSNPPSKRKRRIHMSPGNARDIADSLLKCADRIDDARPSD